MPLKPLFEITNNAYDNVRSVVKEDWENCNPRQRILEGLAYLTIGVGLIGLFNLATGYSTSQNLQGIQERLGTQAALLEAEQETERLQTCLKPLTIGINHSIKNFIQENEPKK
ncbi:hypothetical protein HOC80_05075 [archaeon]|jgi:hypothetical protein|nr:hypothetical protein [archaeon]MBT4417445.1 hypothetical protein [archaeon]